MVAKLDKQRPILEDLGGGRGLTEPWSGEVALHMPFSYARLGVEQMPDVSQPAGTVDVSDPGASPEAVEREVTQPIEEALNSIAGVRRITSSSSEGHSQTSVEFNCSAHMDRAMQEVRDRLSVVQGALPPTVARYNDKNLAIVVLALQSPGRSAREQSMLAEQAVAKRLRRVEGVATVDISGLAAREVRIDLDPARLRANAVTPAQIAEALRDAIADQPVGLLSNLSRESLLRVEGRVREPR